MNRSWCIGLLLLFGSAFGNTHIIGTGKGLLTVTGMEGFQPGDVLLINPGFYEGGSITNLKNITIKNNGGKVCFNKTLILANLTGCSISSIEFKATPGNAFQTTGPLHSVRFNDLLFSGVAASCFDISNNHLLYTGDSNTLGLSKVSFNHIRCVRSGPLFSGSWAAPNLFSDVVDSISWTNIIIDSAIGNGIIVQGNSLYRFDANHWMIHNNGMKEGGDIGIFQIAGSGTIRNIYRYQGRGYIERIWNTGLNGTADSYVYNVIDIASSQYGTIDTRVDPGMLTSNKTFPYTSGANMHVYNITSGNKSQSNHYVTCLGVIGNHLPYSVEFRNCLCFNLVPTASVPPNYLFMINSADGISESNNQYYGADEILAVLADTIECYLNPASTNLIDQGMTVPLVGTDIDGISRPQLEGFDIGGRESKIKNDNATKSESRTGTKESSWNNKHPAQFILICLAAFAVLVLTLSTNSRRNRSIST